MKIEHLREFLCLANEASFSAAADKLFLSQPALSKHIASIEEELQTPLFTRSANGVVLTAEGIVAAEHFALVMAEYDAAIKAIALKRSGFARKIRLAFLQHSLDSERFEASERIRALRPDYEVEVCFKDADDIAEGLRVGTIDVALLLNVRFRGDECMKYQFAKKEPLTLVVQKGDPFCDLDNVTLTDLAGRCLVLPQGADAFARTVSHIFIEQGLPEPTIVYSTQKSTQLYTMREQQGVAIIVEMSKANQPDDVHWVTLDDPNAWVDLCWVYRRDFEDNDLTVFLYQAAGLL